MFGDNFAKSCPLADRHLDCFWTSF